MPHPSEVQNDPVTAAGYSDIRVVSITPASSGTTSDYLDDVPHLSSDESGSLSFATADHNARAGVAHNNSNNHTNKNTDTSNDSSTYNNRRQASGITMGRNLHSIRAATSGEGRGGDARSVSSTTSTTNNAGGKAEKPDIRLWLLQNQLSTLREDVQNFQSSMKADVQDFKEEWKHDNEGFTQKLARNEIAWNTQFSHLTRHIQNQASDIKKYCREELVRKQIAIAENSIYTRITNDLTIPVQEQYRELEQAIQYQSNELRDAVEKQRLTVVGLEKSVNVRKIIVEGLERQIQTIAAEMNAVQKEWKGTSQNLDDTSAKLVDTVQTLKNQWKDQQNTLLKKMGDLESEMFTRDMTFNLRYTEHERLYSQVQEHEQLIAVLRKEFNESIKERDIAQKKYDELFQIHTDQTDELRKLLFDYKEELNSTKSSLTATQTEFEEYKKLQKQDHDDLEQELEEKQELIDQLQTSVQSQAQEISEIKNELNESRIQREDVQKEIAKNMDMQNTLFDYLVRQVQSQSNEIKLGATAHSTLHQTVTSCLPELEKKIESHKLRVDRLTETVKQQESDIVTAREDREGIRRLIDSNESNHADHYRSLQEQLSEQEVAREDALKLRDEAHEKLISIMSVRDSQIDTFVRRIQRQDGEIESLKGTVKTTVQQSAESVTAALKTEMLGMSAKHSQQETKLLQENAELRQDLGNVIEQISNEIKQRNETQSELKSIVTSHETFVNEFRATNSSNSEMLHKHQVVIDSILEDLQSTKNQAEDLTNNLTKEIISRDVQFVQLVDQVQHQAAEFEACERARADMKREICSLMDVRYVMLQHLVRQVQQQGEEIKKQKVEHETTFSTLDEQLTAQSTLIDDTKKHLHDLRDNLTTTVNGELNCLKDKVVHIEQQMDTDKASNAASKKEIDKILTVRQALFDKLVRQVQAHSHELNKSKEEQLEVKRGMIVNLNIEDRLARVETYEGQIKELAEYIHAEKGERIQKEADILQSIHTETNSVRSNLTDFVEKRFLAHNDVFRTMSDNILEKTREERQESISAVDQVLKLHEAELNEVNNQLKETIISISQNAADICSSKLHQEKLHKEVLSRMDGHDACMEDFTKQIQEFSDGIFALQGEVSSNKFLFETANRSLEQKLATDSELVERLNQQVLSCVNDLHILHSQHATHSVEIRKTNADLVQTKKDIIEGTQGQLKQEIIDHVGSCCQQLQTQIDSTKNGINDVRKLTQSDRGQIETQQVALEEKLLTTLRTHNEDLKALVESNKVESETTAKEFNKLLDEHSMMIDTITKNIETTKGDINEISNIVNKQNEQNNNSHTELREEMKAEMKVITEQIGSVKDNFEKYSVIIDGKFDHNKSKHEDLSELIVSLKNEVANVSLGIQQQRVSHHSYREELQKQIDAIELKNIDRTRQLEHQNTTSLEQALHAISSRIDVQSGQLDMVMTQIELAKKSILAIKDEIENEKKNHEAIHCLSSESIEKKMKSFEDQTFNLNNGQGELLKRVERLASQVSVVITAQECQDENLRKVATATRDDTQISNILRQLDLLKSELETLSSEMTESLVRRDGTIDEISFRLESQSMQVEKSLALIEQYELAATERELCQDSHDLERMKVLEERIQAQVHELEAIKAVFVQKNERLDSESGKLAKAIDACCSQLSEHMKSVNNRTMQLELNLEKLNTIVMDDRPVNEDTSAQLRSLYDQLQNQASTLDVLSKSREYLESDSKTRALELQQFRNSIDMKIAHLEGYMHEIQADLSDVSIGQIDESAKAYQEQQQSFNERQEAAQAMMEGYMREITMQLLEVQKARDEHAALIQKQQSMIQGTINTSGGSMDADSKKDYWIEKLHDIEQRVLTQAKELDAVKEYRQGVELELEQKNTALKTVEKKLVATSEQLTEMKWENRGLRVTLNGLQAQQEKYRKSYQKLHDERLKGLLSASRRSGGNSMEQE